ncbi:hypothetical protein ACFLTU_01855 [Bacteroidota bacterium]
MEQKIKKIIKQIGDIGEKTSRLEVGKSIPSIEIDIILEQIRSLYDELRDLQSGTSIQTGEKPAETKDSKVGTRDSELENVPVEQAREPDKIEESIPADKPSEQVKEASGKPVEEPSILADKYQGGKKFMNESLAEKGGKKDISSKIQSKPIQNIGSALGINDRFKLINDLFNGDKGSYENTIKELDGSSNFNEAFSYINSSFDWDMEEESVQLLLELVRRKFIVNQNE